MQASSTRTGESTHRTYLDGRDHHVAIRHGRCAWASVTEVFDAVVTGEAKRDDIREVRNYINALEHGVRRIERDDFPIYTLPAGCRTLAGDPP